MRRTKSTKPKRSIDILNFTRSTKTETPRDLTLQELLSGVYVGNCGSGYEMAVAHKFGMLYEANAQTESFEQELLPQIPGYDPTATHEIYRKHGISDAYVIDLPECSQFHHASCTVYRKPKTSADRQPAWGLIRFSSYVVEPRFYEPLSIPDLRGGILDHYPQVDSRSVDPLEHLKDYEQLAPYANDATGAVTFPVRQGASKAAAEYTRRLKEALEPFGVMSDPVIQLSTPDINPYAINQDNPFDTEHSGHPYALDDTFWDPSEVRPPSDLFRIPLTHKVIPNAASTVPDQVRSDSIFKDLESWRYWNDRAMEIKTRLEDPNIHIKRRPQLNEDHENARKKAQEYQHSLLKDPDALLGLLLSAAAASKYLTESIKPLLHARPGEDFDTYNMPHLTNLPRRVGALFAQGFTKEAGT